MFDDLDFIFSQKMFVSKFLIFFSSLNTFIRKGKDPDPDPC
jgi:hypothetical protein